MYGIINIDPMHAEFMDVSAIFQKLTGIVIARERNERKEWERARWVGHKVLLSALEPKSWNQLKVTDVAVFPWEEEYKPKPRTKLTKEEQDQIKKAFE